MTDDLSLSLNSIFCKHSVKFINNGIISFPSHLIEFILSDFSINFMKNLILPKWDRSKSKFVLQAITEEQKKNGEKLAKECIDETKVAPEAVQKLKAGDTSDNSDQIKVYKLHQTISTNHFKSNINRNFFFFCHIFVFRHSPLVSSKKPNSSMPTVTSMKPKPLKNWAPVPPKKKNQRSKLLFPLANNKLARTRPALP